MELVLHQAPQTILWRFGTSEVSDWSSIMMLPMKRSPQLPSTLMGATFFRHQLIQLSKSGIWDKAIYCTVCTAMKAAQTRLASHRAEISSLHLELIQLWCAGNQIWMRLIPKWLMILAAKNQMLLRKQFQLLLLSRDKDPALQKELQLKLTNLIQSIKFPKFKSRHLLNLIWSPNRQHQPNRSLNNIRHLLRQATMWDLLVNRTQTHKAHNNNNKTTAMSLAQAKNLLSLLRK